ncbi:MAG: AtpZ/AtpI family protein [Candidatus Paceibacterota bacterium]
MKNIKRNNIWYVAGMGTQLGFLIATPIVVCLIIGVAIDKKFNTAPLYILIFLILGSILTVVDVYKLILPFLEKRSLTGKEDKKD